MSSQKTGKMAAMARTDDDSWDITEGVGATALGVAWSRSQEATSQCPLFTDPYAQLFVDAALDRGWQLPPKHMVDTNPIDRGLCGIAHQVVRRVLHRGRRQRYRPGRHPGRGSGRAGLAAAVGGRHRGLRDRPAEGARVQGRDAGATRCEARRVSLRLRTDRSATRLAESPARRRFRPGSARRHGRPKGCCPTCPPRDRTCCSSASPSSALRAAGSRSNRSAPASSIREYLDEPSRTDAPLARRGR